MASAGVLGIRRSVTGNPSLRSFQSSQAYPDNAIGTNGDSWLLAFGCIWKQRFPFFVSVSGFCGREA